jgi:hypothetical protein
VPSTTAAAWAAESSPATSAWAVAGNRPPNRARAVRTRGVGGGGAQPQPAAQPAGGGAGRLVVVGAGGAAGIQGRQPPQPLSLDTGQLSLQPVQVLVQGGIGDPVQVLGGQPHQGCRERIRRPGRGISGPPSRRPEQRPRQ